MNNTLFTLWHGALKMEDFDAILKDHNIDVLVDIRQKPISRYYPHFNRDSIEKKSAWKYEYVFAGNYLWWSPEFHNDLLEYISTRGTKGAPNSQNKLYDFIDETLREKIFSKDSEFSNDEKRKIWITQNFLGKYLPYTKNERATNFLKSFLEQHTNKKICFFCSEKNHLHCHRYHLLSNIWLEELWVTVCHLTQDRVAENYVFSNNKSIFISGSISIKELSEKLLLWLEKIISNQYDIFLWDADWIDKVIQKHFSKKRYERVTVCSMYDTPRTLESHLFRVYKVENTITSKSESEREIQTIKDEFMTKNTDVSFVIWDGMSTGSYQNIIRSFTYNKELQVFLKDRYLTKEELTKENIEKIYEENHKYSLSEYLEIQKREWNTLVKTTKKMKEILVQEKILLWENEEVNTLYEDEITRHNNHWKTTLKYSKSLLDQYFQNHIEKKADQLTLM